MDNSKMLNELRRWLFGEYLWLQVAWWFRTSHIPASPTRWDPFNQTIGGKSAWLQEAKKRRTYQDTAFYAEWENYRPHPWGSRFSEEDRLDLDELDAYRTRNSLPAGWVRTEEVCQPKEN